VLLLGCLLRDSCNNLMYGAKFKKIPGHHEAQNRIPRFDIVSGVRVNTLPVTLALIMSYQSADGSVGLVDKTPSRQVVVNKLKEKHLKIFCG